MGLTFSLKGIFLSALCVVVSRSPGVFAHPTPEAPPAPSTTHITTTPPPLDLFLDPEIRKTHEFTVPCGCWNQCTLLNVAAGGKLLAADNTWGNETISPFPSCEPGWCIPEYMCRDDDGTITPLPDDDVPQEPNILREGNVDGSRRSLQTSPTKLDRRGCLWIVCCEYVPPRPDTDDIGGSIACTIDTDRWDQLF